jgi:hypothetical protein
MHEYKLVERFEVILIFVDRIFSNIKIILQKNIGKYGV